MHSGFENKSHFIRVASKTNHVNGPVRKVHYLEAGSGKPLILLHGGGSSSAEWFNIVEPLSRQFHLYIVDRPGSGLSDPFNYRGINLMEHAADFIRSFMDSLGMRKAIFLAQSMGGYFSICFALRYPERVEKLVIIGAAAGMNRRIPFLLRLMGTRWINGFLMNTIGKPIVENAGHCPWLDQPEICASLIIDLLK